MDVFFLTHKLESLGYVAPAVARAIYPRCQFLDFPATMVVTLVQTYNVSPAALRWWTVGSMFFWSLLVGWMFWKMVAKFFGEGEPDGEFDWPRFQVRFIVGFTVGFAAGFLGLIIGIINGWWFALRLHDPKMILISAVFCGLYVGLAVGVFRPKDIWLKR